MAWTSPRTWVAGEIVTAALLNTHVRDNLRALGDPWPSYTPSVAGFTLGNGSVVGAYRQVGKTIDVRVRLTAGSTTVSSAGLNLGLPIATHSAFVAASSWFARDISAGASFTGMIDVGPSATVVPLRNTNPFAWAAGDYIGFALSYESV